MQRDGSSHTGCGITLKIKLAQGINIFDLFYNFPTNCTIIDQMGSATMNSD